jgi:hypothetical protein
MPYSFLAFISVTLFALIHIYANKIRKFDEMTQARFLSGGQGVAIAYVFITLLPKLCLNDTIVKQSLKGIFPYFEKHVYVMALAGFLLFFIVDRTRTESGKNKKYWLSLCSYALFNFLVGYAVTDKNNPEVKPLALFTFAMGLHYFANDYSLNKNHGEKYTKSGKWILVFCLFMGWLVGYFASLSAVAIALVSAFIGGGMIMNVTRRELPMENPRNLQAFLICAVIYTVLLLAIG